MVTGAALLFVVGLIIGYKARPDRVTKSTVSVEAAPRVIFVTEPQTQVEFVEPGKGRR